MELKTFFAQDTSGNVLVSPQVYVYQAGTTNPALGVKDKNGNALACPFAGTAGGQVQFQAPTGTYDVRVVKGLRDYTITVRCVDPTEIMSAAAAQATQQLNDAQVIIAGFAGNAAVAAAIAQSAAAGASSVLAQDLSNFSGALHRSPNPIVCQPILIDPAKDSNPQWPQQCAHLSWANRTLNGAWLGWHAAEASARACNGATGAEAVTGADPTFASGAGWATGAGHAIGSGLLTLTNAANGTATTTTGTASVIGTVYKVACTRALTAGGVRVTYGGKTFDFYPGASDPIYLAATAASTAISVSAIGVTSGSVDAISIKPVTANVTNTGDYFGNTTDGKFYALNAGAGITETFDGNSNVFGRMAVVADSLQRLVLYSIDLPGRPMWMVFAGNGGLASSWLTFANGGPTVKSVDWCDGVLGIAVLNNGTLLVDFSKNDVRIAATASAFTKRSITDRNSPVVVVPGDGYPMPFGSGGVPQSVSLARYPNAPIDPVTNLVRPTVAIGIGGGGAVIITSAGEVCYDGGATATCVSLTPYGLLIGYSNFTTVGYVANPDKLTAGGTLPTAQLTAGAFGGTGFGASQAIKMSGRSMIAKASTAQARVSMMRLNESTPAASITASITDTFNTGWMVGDIRRAVLSDVNPGVASGVDALATAVWTYANCTGTGTFSAGAVDFTANVSGGWFCGTMTGLTPGQTYRLAFTRPNAGYLIRVGTVGTLMDLGGENAGGAGTFMLQFVAPANGTAVVSLCSVGGTQILTSNMSVVAAAFDRSYKNKPLTVFGALTKAAVAAGAQLVAYSGFSAANYLQEAASTDLDPGAGAVRVGLYGTIPANVAAAGWGADRSAAAGGSYYRLGHDATGKIVAELFDGTTTRTLTTALAYNTGQFLKAVMEYVPNGASSTLTIKVNGRQVAQGTIAALNSLSNAAAVFTVGINRALTAPWAGSLCMVKVGMTVAAIEGETWAYDDEREMFRAGAQVTLPDSGAVTDLAYDPMQKKWKTASAANESSFTGMVRTASAPSPAGSISYVAHDSGIRVLARAGTNQGADVAIPAQNLREELAAARARQAVNQSAPSRPFDFDATTGQTDFTLPAGWEVERVVSGGSTKRESPTSANSKDWMRVFDGFRETVRFAVAPGNGVWVQVWARKA
jgi:hypothetical protein